jgi:monoamine oxidase
VLAEPLGPLLFAGEATHRGLAGTIGGAWAEGQRAAQSVLDNPPAA